MTTGPAGCPRCTRCSRQRPPRSSRTDQEQLASEPRIGVSSTRMPRMRSMPRRSAAPWPTTTASWPSSRVSAIRVQRAGHPVGDDQRRLAVRRVPGGALGRVALADLGVGQALPVAAEPLAQVLVQRDRQAGQPGQRRGGLLGAGQVGGERSRPGRSVARRRAACSACASPVASSGMSVCPWNRCSTFQVVWPCRHSTSRLAALSVRLRSSPGCRRWPPRAAG